MNNFIADESVGGQASAKISGTIDKVSPPVIVNIIFLARKGLNIKEMTNCNFGAKSPAFALLHGEVFIEVN